MENRNLLKKPSSSRRTVLLNILKMCWYYDLNIMILFIENIENYDIIPPIVSIITLT